MCDSPEASLSVYTLFSKGGHRILKQLSARCTNYVKQGAIFILKFEIFHLNNT